MLDEHLFGVNDFLSCAQASLDADSSQTLESAGLRVPQAFDSKSLFPLRALPASRDLSYARLPPSLYLWVSMRTQGTPLSQVPE